MSQQIDNDHHHQQPTYIKQSINLLYQKKAGAQIILNNEPNLSNQPHPMLPILMCTMNLFSFSRKHIESTFPTDLKILTKLKLSTKETLYRSFFQNILEKNLRASFDIINTIVQSDNTDPLAILLLETIGFISGLHPLLEPIYKTIKTKNQKDANFMAMLAFLYCHHNKQQQARALLETALTIEPHNAWIQHVYAHTTIETDKHDVTMMIQFMEQHHSDWPTHNRFFEGHNWMHLCLLYIQQQSKTSEQIIQIYHQHIWGECKEAGFEQNNAFLALWALELSYGLQPIELWNDLANHAAPFIDDYFTPYLTITAILAVAKVNMAVAKEAAQKMRHYALTLQAGSHEEYCWLEVGCPLLDGMIAYLEADYTTAITLLQSTIQEEYLVGHSDEQRFIFKATLNKSIKMASNI